MALNNRKVFVNKELRCSKRKAVCKTVVFLNKELFF